MKDISGLPNIDTPTANRDLGEMRDDTVPGDGNGTPVREDWMQDMYYALRAVLNAAGKTPDDSEEGVTASQFLDSLIQIAEPIGTIKDWHKTMPNTPSLTSWYVECDGAVISDADSPFNGYRSPNLNGADVILSLSWTADAGGAYATVGATDVTALAVGDKVSGSGITPVSGDNYTYITDITGSVVKIGDVSASGTISSTFTNDGRFTRGASTSGGGQIDEGQKHRHNQTAYSGSGGISGVPFFTTQLTLNTTSETTDPISDGVNGIPRMGEENRPINTGMVKIMKIK